MMAAILLTSCETAVIPEENVELEEVSHVEFFAPDYSDDIGTKTVLNGSSFSWDASDVVGIYPDKGSQIFFEMTEGAGTNSAVFDGGGWGFRSGAVYYSYYPFIPDYYLDRHHIPVDFTGQHQNGSSVDQFGKYDFMYAPGVSVSNSSISFNYHHLQTIIYVRATLPAGTYRQLTITAPSNAFVLTGYYDLEAKTPEIIPETTSRELTVVLDNFTLSSQSTIDIYLFTAPVDLSGSNVTVSILDSQKKQYDCVKSITKQYLAGTKYGMACSTWTEVPQSVGLAIGVWGDGGNFSGDAE